jgi:hemolysin activation/secretion protein
MQQRITRRGSEHRTSGRRALNRTHSAWAWTAAGLAFAAGSAVAWAQQSPPAAPAPTEKSLEKAADAGVNAKKEAAATEAPQNDAMASFDVPSFVVTQFNFEYADNVANHPKIPALADILEEAQVTLYEGEGGGLIGRPIGKAIGPVSVASLTKSLGEGQPRKLSALALRSVLFAVRDALVNRGLIGVFVEVDRNDIESSATDLKDLRPDDDGRTTLKVAIFAPIVTKVRTVAAGNRVTSEQRVDAPEHEHIRTRSPVKPQTEGETDRNDLLNKRTLDDYVLRLNRYPNRRVDIALSGDDTESSPPGSVVVDYLVREASPLLLYVQGSNTGTRQSGEWRERFGMVYNQLLGRDDVLTADYVTADFKTTHAFNGSYELPLDEDRKLKLKALGSFTQYDASEVGRAGERFGGESYSVGGELSYNLFQWRELFVDAFAGMRFQRVRVTNRTIPIFPIRGQTDFVLPNAGLRVDRFTDEANSAASVTFEWNEPSIAGTDNAQLPRLGRLNTDDRWVTMQFAGEQSLFLEPIFDRDNWLAGKSTLAHEMSFSLRGQWSFSDRLVPNYQQVAGGLYSVRGYPESVASGDTVVIGTAEYRLHIPRLFAIDPEPPMFMGEPFRWAPQQPYGRPDWDLIFRAFVDVGQTINYRPTVGEFDERLVGAGFGFELQLRRNLNVRVDFGWALENVRQAGGGNKVESGDSRVHFVGTLLF